MSAHNNPDTRSAVRFEDVINMEAYAGHAIGSSDRATALSYAANMNVSPDVRQRMSAIAQNRN